MLSLTSKAVILYRKQAMYTGYVRNKNYICIKLKS